MTTSQMLFCAVKNNYMDLFEQLMQKEKIDLNCQDKDGFTPLIYASAKGRKEMVQALIERGADLDKGNLNGDGPLMWSILYNYQTISKMLIENGADVDAQNIRGETPLMAAAYNGDGELLHLMMAQGATVSLVDKKGETAADKAFKRGYIFLAKHLRNAVPSQKKKLNKAKRISKNVFHSREG